MKQLSESSQRSASLTGKRALQTAAITGCLMCVFEVTKMAISPHIGIWSSHSLTVLFVTVMAAISSFTVLRRNELLRLETTSTEERYKLLFERSLAGAYRTSLDGIILDCNVAFCQMFGYESREEVIGSSVEIGYVNAADRTLFLNKLRTEKIVINFEQRLKRKDGTFVAVLNSATLLTRDDGTGGVIRGTLTDITVLRNAELQNRRLAAIVRCTDDAILSLTLEGMIETWNRGAERIYGYTAEEAIGRSIGILAPSDRSNETLRILQRVAHSDEVSELETIRVTKDGRTITVALSISPLTDAAGVVIGASTIARDITDRKRAEEMLQDSESKYRALFEDSADAYWLLDEAGFQDCNAAALQMFGFTSRDDFKHPADISPQFQPDGAPSEEAAKQRIASALLDGKARFDWLHRRKNGEVFPAEVCLTALTLNDRRILLASVRDMSAHKNAEEALLFRTALLEAQMETTIDGILVVDESGRVLLSNDQFRHCFDIPEKVLEAGEDRIVLKDVTDQVQHSDDFFERVKYLYAHPHEKSRDEFRLKNGKTVDRYSAPLVDSNGRYRGRIWYFRDITQRKATEERIQFLAYFDALTELPNRTLLHDRLKKAVAGARRRNEQVALLFLDIDHFKLVNDSLGHAVGDHLLKQFAGRLKGFTRDQDTVARVGGDEFVIVLSGIKSQAEVATAAKRVLNAISGRFVIQGHTLSTSCSVGISIFPDHCEEVERLIQFADQAMYWAKEKGRNNYQFFTEEMNIQVVQQLTLENDLRQAIEHKEFFLVYQPQVEVSSGRIVGIEALIRWPHPKLGLVPPDKFIPVAEKNGLILPIGEWVLEAACSQVRNWQEAGLRTVPVSVNVSAVQFRQEGFCELIQRVLQETGLAPQYLELELTESLLMSNADLMFTVLRELKQMGLKLAIDDFGTGYSSLSYLKQFPVNKLKIDRSFIQNLSSDSDDAAITSAIINMAKGLNLRVIAEGVETEEQLSFLREHKCDEIQGYYFSKPITANELAEKWLSSGSQPDMTAGIVFQLPSGRRSSRVRVRRIPR